MGVAGERRYCSGGQWPSVGRDSQSRILRAGKRTGMNRGAASQCSKDRTAAGALRTLHWGEAKVLLREESHVSSAE